MSGAEFSGGATFVWEAIETAIIISWSEEGKSAGWSRVSFQTAIRLSWSEILRHLPAEPNQSWNRTSLMRVFANSLAGTFKPVIEKRGFAKIARLTGHIDSKVFGRILAAVVGQGILRVAERPKYVKQRGSYWKVTKAGLKRIKEAQGRGTANGE